MNSIAKTLLEHQGYFGSVEIDVESDRLHGTVQGINDIIHYEAESPRALEQAFRDSVTDYLAFCADRNEKPERPYSGRFNARIAPATHRKAASMAAAQGVSLNDLVIRALEREIQTPSPAPKRTRQPG